MHSAATKLEANQGIFILKAINEFNYTFKNINGIKINEEKNKNKKYYEDNDENNNLEEIFIKESDAEDDEDDNMENKIKLFSNEFIGKYKNNCFILINGQKYTLSKCLYKKDIKNIIKNIEEKIQKKYYEKKDYQTFNIISLCYYPNKLKFINIDSNPNESNVFLLDKEIQLEDIAYSIFYLKNNKLIVLGMEKKCSI